MKRRNSGKSRMLIFGSIVGMPFLLLYIFIGFYYHNHFYTNTKINGINTSNMTVSKAQEIISADINTYQLNIMGRNNLTDTINGKDINLRAVFDNSVSELLRKQNVLSWPVAIFHSHEYEADTMTEYDEALLKTQFNNLNCFQKENNLEPVNASISEYGANGYEIIPEQPGAKVKKDKLYEAVRTAVNSLQPTISIEEADCYEKPEITSQRKELQQAIKEMNRITGAEITYKFGKTTEVLDGEKISQWITLDPDYKVHFNEEGVREFVDYIGRTYNSFGRVREFKTSYGKVIKVKGGDYGWWLNRPEETDELVKLIQDGEKLIKTPVYYQTAQQYGADDIGDTYVEVNLSAQHLFFYKDGKLILESDFVSGNVSKHLGTPTGTYPIQYKENDATLVGEDYETPVKYWMPFNKNIGFHDASWRDEFGGKIYMTNGSHGCINMPPAAAKKMFKNIKRGVAVVVYKLPVKSKKDNTE